MKTFSDHVTRLITNAPKRAELKFLTLKWVDHLEVSSSIAALITKLKSPSVRTMAGKVRNFKSEPMKVLINPKRSATHKYAQNPPVTVMPGSRAVAIQIARAKTLQRKSNLMP